MLSSSTYMATTSTRSKSLDDKMEKHDQSIQQVQGDVLLVREDVQSVCSQLNELTFKFSTLMADWQQQKGQAFFFH